MEENLDSCYAWLFQPVLAISLAHWVYYVGTLVFGIGIFQQYFWKAYRTHWFDVSLRGWLEKPEWDPDIKVLTLQDPLDYKWAFRAGLPFQLTRDLAATALLCLLWYSGLRGIKLLETNPSKDNIEVATFLIGFLGLAGTATKVVYEWRLKARSENRQKWIDQLRETLATLIQNIPIPNEDQTDLQNKRSVYFAQHGKLELLMNPSERDHRALMAMIRHIYGFSAVPIDDVPRQALGLGSIDPHKKSDFDKLKSQIIRLANVVLKREWERVKHVQ